MCTVETFYSVLGVARDADEQTIVRAYRDEAKSRHPDVCDSPDATETFKRLTAAKAVLVDETERSRYDRLGHEAYLAEYGECCGWSVEAGVTTGTETVSATANAVRAYADGGSPTAEATPKQDPTRAASGGTATAYYRPGQRMNPGAAASASERIRSRFRSIGPWLLIDVVLLVSAVATAWLVLSWGSLSALSLVLAAVLFVCTLAVTSLHLSVRAFT